MNKPHKGGFQPGIAKSYVRICDTCGQEHVTTTPVRKRCPACCVCRTCGKQLPNATFRSCSRECGHQWRALHEPEETKKRRAESISKALKGRTKPRGADNALWKGGKKDRRDVMGRLEYRIWRETVFKRDGHRCLFCSSSSGTLQAHHIRQWINHPDLRYEPDNGVTLCRPCHESIDGKEDHYADRFLAYVTTRAPVYLTDDELDRLRPFITTCSQCGKEVRRKPYDRHHQFYFCDLACKRAFEARPPVTAWGETKPLAEWARDSRCSVRYMALYSRLDSGMSPEEAIGTPSLAHADQHYCPQGHEFTPENTIIRPSEGWRRCATCTRERDRKRGEKSQSTNGVRTRTPS